MFNAKSNNKSTYNKVKHLEQIHCLIDSYNKVHLLFYETKPTSTFK